MGADRRSWEGPTIPEAEMIQRSNRALSLLAVLAAFCLGLAACSTGGGCGGGCDIGCPGDVSGNCCVNWDFYDECDLIEGAESAGCNSCQTCAPAPCAAGSR